MIYSSKMMDTSIFCIRTDWIEICSCYGHTRDECAGCSLGFHWIPLLTYTYCSTGGGGDSNPNSTGSDGNSNSEESENITVDPIMPDFLNKTPCVSLNEKTRATAFNNRLALLNTDDVLSENHKTGFIEGRNDLNAPTFIEAMVNPNTHKLFFPQMSCLGYAHVHNDDYTTPIGDDQISIKIFSPQDLKTFTVDCQEYAISKEIPVSETYGIVITRTGIFALKMLTATVNVDNIDWEDFNDDYKLEVEELKKNNELSSTNLQKMFLNFLKEKGIYNNVGLYEATNSDLTQWSRKILNGDTLMETPCNN